MATTCARGKQRDYSSLCGCLQFDSTSEGGAPLRASSAAIFETSLERGVVRRVWRSLRTRERRAEWRVGGPPARESCFGLGVSACRPVAISGATTLRR
jgi:hypothetical protein